MPLENSEAIKIAKAEQESDLYILPYLGTDKKLYRKIKKAAKEKNIYVITLETSKHSTYLYRQKYEEFCTVYDVATFLDKKYWQSFIQYVKQSRKIGKIIYEEKCKNNNLVYTYQKIQYKITHSIPIRAIKKIGRCINRKEA